VKFQPFVKMTLALKGKPEIRRMVAQHGWTKREVIGACYLFWAYAFEQGSELIEYFGPSDIDDLTGLEGFGEALASVGWVKYEGQDTSVVNYDYHLSMEALRKALKSERDARYNRKRRQNGASTTDERRINGAYPSIEKNRIERDTSAPPGGGSDGPSPEDGPDCLRPSRDDLDNPEALRGYYADAVGRGYAADTSAGFVDFVALALRSLDRPKPVAYFRRALVNFDPSKISDDYRERSRELIGDAA
jgi:hypothetical protein